MPDSRGRLWLIVILFVGIGLVASILYHRYRGDDIQVAQGRQAYDAGRFEIAEEAYDRATRLDASNAEAWYWLGVSRKNQGKSASAAEALARAVELAPDRTNWWIEYAQALEWARRYDDARQAWSQVIDRLPPDDPRIPQMQATIARILAMQGKLDQAIESLEKQLEASDAPSLRFTLAELLAWKGRFDESAEQYERALSASSEPSQ